MNVLDSPLEALAFNYVSFGFFTFVNNLWTWIAVVTAAVSFWRIRVAGGGFPAVESPPLDDRTSCVSSSPPVPEKTMTTTPSSSPPEEKPSSPSPSPSPSPSLRPSQSFEELGATRGSPKFSLYYRDNDTGAELTVTEEEEPVESDGELTVTRKDEVLGGNDGDRGGDGDGDGDEWWGSWERALRTRMGESETAGWYRYQDLTELNGNVVRLWDGRQCGRRTTTTSGSVESYFYSNSKRCVLW